MPKEVNWGAYMTSQRPDFRDKAACHAAFPKYLWGIRNALSVKPLFWAKKDIRTKGADQMDCNYHR